MSTPVVADNLVQGAVRFLSAKTDLIAKLGQHQDGSPWVFQNMLQVVMEGSQGAALVLSNPPGEWASPNVHNTQRFPRLEVNLWVDALRNSSRQVTEPGETFRRSSVIIDLLDRYLHRTSNVVQYWGSLRTISCSRLSLPVPYPVPDGDGLLKAQGLYAVGLG